MVCGIGVDICSIIRIYDAIQRNVKFIERIFTAIEIKAAPSEHYSYYAKRFAAKEALMKACGAFLSWQEITVHRGGQPHFELYGSTYELLKNHTIHLSLSDEKTYAVAFVVISSP